MNITEIKGGVTAAKGFEAAAAAAAIKYQGRTDMALVYSEKPCHAAGTFTTNIVKAAPEMGSENRKGIPLRPGSHRKLRHRQRLHRQGGHGLL